MSKEKITVCLMGWCVLWTGKYGNITLPFASKSQHNMTNKIQLQFSSNRNELILQYKHIYKITNT